MGIFRTTIQARCAHWDVLGEPVPGEPNTHTWFFKASPLLGGQNVHRAAEGPHDPGGGRVFGEENVEFLVLTFGGKRATDPKEERLLEQEGTRQKEESKTHMHTISCS